MGVSAYLCACVFVYFLGVLAFTCYCTCVLYVSNSCFRGYVACRMCCSSDTLKQSLDSWTVMIRGVDTSSGPKDSLGLLSVVHWQTATALSCTSRQLSCRGSPSVAQPESAWRVLQLPQAPR